MITASNKCVTFVADNEKKRTKTTSKKLQKFVFYRWLIEATEPDEYCVKKSELMFMRRTKASA